MSLRSYSQGRILARLAAQDREEGLQRRQAQQDAANRIGGLSALDRLVGLAGQVPGIIKAEQAESDRKLLEEVGLAADIYGSEMPETSAAVTSGAAAALPERLNEPMTGIPEPGEGGMPTDTSPTEGGMATNMDPIVLEMATREMAEKSAAGLADVAAARQAAAARLTGPAPAPAEVRLEPREIDSGAAMVSPTVVTRRGAARAAAQRAAPAPQFGAGPSVRPEDVVARPPATPDVKLQSSFPTANRAHDRAMELARQLARTEPFMARKLQAAASALRAAPEITANFENVEAAIADAERLPMETVQLRAQAPAEAAPQKTDEVPPATGATEMYREKVAAEREARKPTAEKPVSAPVARYASTLDEELAKTGVQLSPLMRIDAGEAGDAIVDSVIAGQPVEANSLAGSIARFLGQRPSERAIRVARLAATRRVKERQVAERQAAYKEAVERVKLAEQRGGATAGSRARAATSAADFAKYRDMEQEGAVDAIIGRHGDKLMAAAKIADPGERARAVSAILTIDSIPATELNTADEIRGRIISDMTEFGEDFMKARKTKAEKEKEAKPLEVPLVKELVGMKTSYKDLTDAAESVSPALNAAMAVASATGAVGRTVSQIFGDRIKADPKAIAGDAAIRRNIAAYLKATSGLATTDAEYERIRASAPNETDPPDVYYAKLNDFLAQIANYHDTLLNTAEASGRSIGKLERIGPAKRFGPGGEISPADIAAEKQAAQDAKDLE